MVTYGQNLQGYAQRVCLNHFNDYVDCHKDVMKRTLVNGSILKQLPTI